MRKAKIVIAFIICMVVSLANAQRVVHPAHLFGHIIDRSLNEKQDSVICSLIKNNFSTTDDGLASTWSVPVDANGSFKVNLGMLKTPARVYLSIAHAHGLPEILVEPGDNVRLDINIIPENVYPNGDIKHIQFQGKGSNKMECQQELGEIKLDQAFAWIKWSKINFSADRGLSVADSVLHVQFNILNHYKNKISSLSYEILRADIIGKTLIFSNIASFKLTEPKQYAFELCKADFLKYSNCFQKYRVQNPSVIPYSKPYLELLLNKEEVALAIEKHSNVYEFKDWYNWLATKYVGTLREKLISYYLIEKPIRERGGMYIPVVDGQQYKDALTNACAIVADPALRSKLVKRMRLAKGACAYNFNLPLDSTSRHLQLSDLRGKVVLLDRWSFDCSPCFRFATVFHEKIYPLLKDNPKFAYVSIMGGGNTMVEYKRRLNNVDEHGKTDPEGRFTAPEYINLRGCEDGFNEVLRMDSYYNVHAVPFILLIDKKGKIYSSTIPFVEASDSPNIQKLTDLINKALAEKD